MFNLSNKNYKNKVGFSLGTGRCGTKFFSQIVSLEPNIASVHERNPLNETFHRYGKWYDLPIDHEGFLQTKEREIKQDLKQHSFSFEASAFVSLSIKELYERFDSKFILLIRSPEKVVNSYLRKGWYDKPTVRFHPNLIPSYQDCSEFHHFLGRIMPSGKKFEEWNKMSRVGKLAWYWNTINAEVIKQFDDIPQTHWRIEKLEDFSYSKYQEISQFLGFKTQVTEKTYDQLKKRKPNAKINIPTVAAWNQTEIREFEAEVASMAQKFQYKYKINNISSEKPTKLDRRYVVSEKERIQMKQYSRDKTNKIKKLIDKLKLY